MTNLGRLTRLTNFREYWKTEDRHFTPWLSDDDNISILGETLQIDLEVEAVEKSVGPFRADILCRDTDDGSLVLIENQLERTDHKHLGQLMTYAAGLDTATIVWIAVRFDDEHRAALDWLNEKTDDSLRFFGVEIELWRIGEGPAAPKFNIVSKPNEWTRSVGRAARRIKDEALTPRKVNNLEYWTEFNQLIADKSTVLRAKKPQANHWMTYSIGKTHVVLSGTLNSRENYLGVELYLSNDNAKFYFDDLRKDHENIESKLGYSLDWQRLPNTTKASRIFLIRKNSNPNDKSRWPEYQTWMLKELERFHHIFKPYVSQFKPLI